MGMTVEPGESASPKARALEGFKYLRQRCGDAWVKSARHNPNLSVASHTNNPIALATRNTYFDGCEQLILDPNGVTVGRLGLTPICLYMGTGASWDAEVELLNQAWAEVLAENCGQ
jgi:hypothetical protein